MKKILLTNEQKKISTKKEMNLLKKVSKIIKKKENTNKKKRI